MKKKLADVVEDIRRTMNRCKLGWRKSGHDTADEALAWYRAYSIAEDIVESYTTKDIAHMIIDGVGPIPESLEGNATEMWGEAMDEEEWEMIREEILEFYGEER